MGKLWCAALPVVTVPQSDTVKPVTLIHPYYENSAFLRLQVAGWAQCPATWRRGLSVIIVDDGSPRQAVDVLSDLAHPLPIRLFRIEQDVRWNWLAARNLAAHHARGWLLMTDMDHVVPPTTIRSVVYGQHDPGVVYGFSRMEHTGERIAPHPNSWLMTREMFWRIGGYDEALSGHYGTDGEWRRRVAAVAPIQILTDHLVRHEYVADSSTTTYQRKQPQDAAVRGIIAMRGRGWRPKTLSFPYHEVMLRHVEAVA